MWDFKDRLEPDDCEERIEELESRLAAAQSSVDEFARMLAIRESAITDSYPAHNEGWRLEFNSDCRDAVDYLVGRGLAERHENSHWWRLKTEGEK
jgi:hypothetical protein